MLRATAAPRPLPLDGETTLLLTAEVDDPDLPGDELTVVVDLSPLEGPSRVVMFDDGKDPDPLENDGEFTLEFIPSYTIPPGIRTIVMTVFDREGDFDVQEVQVEVYAEADCRFTMSDRSVFEGQIIHMELRIVTVIPVDKVLFISEIIPEGGRLELNDGGRNGDLVAGDSVYSTDLTVLSSPGRYNYSVRVVCGSGSELVVDEGVIDIAPLPEEDDVGNVAPIVALLLSGAVIAAIVVVLIGLFVTRSGRKKDEVVYQAVVQETPVQFQTSSQPPPMEPEVVIAEVLP